MITVIYRESQCTVHSLNDVNKKTHAFNEKIKTQTFTALTVIHYTFFSAFKENVIIK